MIFSANSNKRKFDNSTQKAAKPQHIIMVLHVETQDLILTWFFSNQEVEYSEEPGNLYFIKYRVAGGTRYFSLYRLYCIETFHYLIVNGHFIIEFVCHQILVFIMLYSNFHFLENDFA